MKDSVNLLQQQVEFREINYVEEKIERKREGKEAAGNSH